MSLSDHHDLAPSRLHPLPWRKTFVKNNRGTLWMVEDAKGFEVFRLYHVIDDAGKTADFIVAMANETIGEKTDA